MDKRLMEMKEMWYRHRGEIAVPCVPQCRWLRSRTVSIKPPPWPKCPFTFLLSSTRLAKLLENHGTGNRDKLNSFHGRDLAYPQKAVKLIFCQLMDGRSLLPGPEHLQMLPQFHASYHGTAEQPRHEAAPKGKAFAQTPWRVMSAGWLRYGACTVELVTWDAV